MDSILKDLFNGKIYPYENLVPQEPEYPALKQKTKEENTYFYSVISDDDRKRFEDLENMKTTLSDMESVEAFSRGFRLAVRLITDVYYHNGDLPDILKQLTAEKPD